MLDRAPVGRHAQRAADPSRLWVQAVLFGLEPPPLGQGCVLELGCGDAGHLLGIAARHPALEVVGVDPRQEAIAEGRALAERAGIANLRLVVGDLASVAPWHERCDFVLCEGVLSRASAEEREALLGTTSRLLTSSGLACLDYDVRPAFRQHELLADLLRRALRYRGSELTSSSIRSELELLLDEGAAGRGLELLRTELEGWRRRDDAWLLAELTAPRQGLSFSELEGRLASHGLSYVCESSYLAGSLSRLAGAPRELAERQAPRARRERYVDFFCERRQRRSVLCRAARPVSEVALPERSATLFCVSPLQPGQGDAFVVPGGHRLRIEDPLSRALVTLAAAAWPEALPFEELEHGARKRHPATSTDELGRALLFAYDQDWLELRPSPTGCGLEAGERPRVSRLNRAELAAGRPLTNALHAPIQLGGGVAGSLVALLDGASDRRELGRLLVEQGHSAAHTTPAAIEQVLTALVRRGLVQRGEGSS